MTETKFYEDLDSSNVDTIVVNGSVLLYKNRDKWHLCKKHAGRVRFACGSSSPRDPKRSDWSMRRFEQRAAVVEPVDALGAGRWCHNCERIFTQRFGFEKVTVVVTDDEAADIERFLNERSEMLEQ